MDLKLYLDRLKLTDLVKSRSGKEESLSLPAHDPEVFLYLLQLLPPILLVILLLLGGAAADGAVLNISSKACSHT